MSSIVLARTVSLFDGAPIRVVLTTRTVNRKLKQDWCQLWVLPDAWSPVQAVADGLESATCGPCPLKHGQGCYVLRWQSPDRIYRATHDKPAEPGRALDAIRWKALRFTAFGDPGALPSWLVAAVCCTASKVVGYTHAWHTRPDLAPWCMASCETADDAIMAQSVGFRTFRVSRTGQPSSAERACPGACEQCMACQGTRVQGGSVVIAAHGARKNRMILEG